MMQKIFFILLLIPTSIFSQKLDSLKSDTIRREYLPFNVYDTVPVKIWIESESSISVLDSTNIRIDGNVSIIYVGWIVRQLNKWVVGKQIRSDINPDKYIDTDIFLYKDKINVIDNGKIWMHRYIINNY
jgi:hypothetical protein